MTIKEKKQQRIAKRKEQAIERLRLLSPADKKLAEESVGLTMEELVLGIEEEYGRKGRLIYGGVTANADGCLGVMVLVMDPIVYFLILSINTVGGLAIRTETMESPPRKGDRPFLPMQLAPKKACL